MARYSVNNIATTDIFMLKFVNDDFPWFDWLIVPYQLFADILASVVLSEHKYSTSLTCVEIAKFVV